jgi:trehalose 6-phosphate phosphatase
VSRSGDVAFRALVCDLDGVVTDTASLHATAWKRLFDAELRRRAAPERAPFRAFEIATDYVRHVDGRRRYDGVDAFLRSRGIELPWGGPGDPAGRETVCGLGNLKNQYFEDELRRAGVHVYRDAVALIRGARSRGLRTAVVSASENCDTILQQAGLAGLFDATVTGRDAARLQLAGKPAPDTFLAAAARLGVAPRDCVVLEDSLAGVAAGRTAGFGLVVGVDRRGGERELRRAGADAVYADLSQLELAAAPPV